MIHWNANGLSCLTDDERIALEGGNAPVVTPGRSFSLDDAAIYLHTDDRPDGLNLCWFSEGHWSAGKPSEPKQPDADDSEDLIYDDEDDED